MKLSEILERKRRDLAGMEDSALQVERSMEAAQARGEGVDPRDAVAYEARMQGIANLKAEIDEIVAVARSTARPAGEENGPARSLDAMPDGRRVDIEPLMRALRSSGNLTAGMTVCRALIQGTSTGNLGRLGALTSPVTMGVYGAVPLSLALQTIPTLLPFYAFNRIEPVTAPAMGAVQSAEGAAKTQVAIKGAQVELVLPTWQAYEKISTHALADHPEVAGAAERILTGAVLRAADAGAWTRLVAGSTAITASADAISTIVLTAATIAAAGGSGIRAIVNPLDWANVLLTRTDGSGEWLGLPPGVQMPPIVQSSGIPSGKLLVTAGDDGAFTVVRQAIDVQIGLDADDFTKNLRTMLVEGRMTSDVRNPAFSYAGDLIEVETP